jgi:N-acetylneuraminic acid mutarotase
MLHLRITFALVTIMLILFLSCSKEETPTQPPSQEEKTKPNAPLLISPSNNADSVSQSPMLIWHSSKWADSYSLQVSKNSAFTSDIIVSLNNLTDTTYTLTNLDFNAKYYWRVNATNSLGTSNWTNASNFTITSQANRPPNIPTNPSPANNSFNLPPKLNLHWDCSDPDGDSLTYRIIVYEDGRVIQDSLVNNKFFPSSNWCPTGVPLYYNSTFQWKVIAADTKGGSSESPLWSFKTEVSLYTVKSKLPTERTEFAAVQYYDKLYVIGGSISGNLSTLVEIYDFNTNSWSTGIPIPYSVNASSAVVCNDKIYVLGGYVAGQLSPLRVFDPQLNSWTILNSNIPKFMTGFSVAAVENKIYVFGGRLWLSQDYSSVIYIYDTTSDTWSQSSSYVLPRAYSGYSVFNNKIYISGGRGFPPTYTEFSTRIEEFDPTTELVRTIGQINGYPDGKEQHTAIRWNSKIFLFGGVGAGCQWNPHTIELDPATGTVKEKRIMANPLDKFSIETFFASGHAAVFNNKIYYLEGYGGNYLLQYDPQTEP